MTGSGIPKPTTCCERICSSVFVCFFSFFFLSFVRYADLSSFAPTMKKYYPEGAATTPLGKSVVAPGMMYFANVEAAKVSETKKTEQQKNNNVYKRALQRELQKLRC